LKILKTSGYVVGIASFIVVTFIIVAYTTLARTINIAKMSQQDIAELTKDDFAKMTKEDFAKLEKRQKQIIKELELNMVSNEAVLFRASLGRATRAKPDSWAKKTFGLLRFFRRMARPDALPAQGIK
jgi:hypothetical protein